MSESKSASVVFTNGSYLAKNAQQTADSAKSAAQEAQALANGAQKTADGKNSVYRGSDPSTVPTGGLKEGDIYFTDNTLYTWNGSAWEKTVSDTTGEEIHEKVEAAMRESQKSVADLESRVEDKVKKLDDEIAHNKIQTGNALNFYKEQYYLSTSYTELAGGSWSDEVPGKEAGKYVWSRYVTANIGDSTNYQYSAPVCISGLDGAQGPQGDQGIQGPTGPQGLPSYTHIAYANSSDGKTGFDVSNGTGKTYIGVYCDSEAADSTEPTKYTWSLIKGERGDQGIPGTKGSDGQTPYFHIAYADSSDGSIGFDTTNSSGKLYIGQYTDYTQADSTNPASYKWTKIKGETGQTGATGPQGADGTDAPTITVKSYTFSAANGAMADIELTGPNAFKQTVYSRGHNVWVFDATTHKLKESVNCDTFTTMSFNHNGANTTLADYLAGLTDSIVVIAAADADSIDQNVRNVLNSMGGSPELGTWPGLRVGHVFIGMSKRSDDTWPLQPLQGYEEAIIKDGSAPEIGCTLSNGGIVANGAPGATGAQGPQGPQGDIGPQGIPGPKGADGQTTYVHVAYANSADGKFNFSVNYFANALYIGVLTDYTQEDSTDYTKYTWSRLKGDQGDQGIPGPKGIDGQTTYVHFAYANITDLAEERSNFTLSTQTVARFGSEDSGKWLYKELAPGTYTATVDLFGSDPAVWVIKKVQAFSDFSVSDSNARAYIGQYTDYTQADSTNPASYSWTKIKGDQGPQGPTGATGPQGPQGETGFFIGTTPPPKPTKGTVWATDDSSGNMTSAKTWNGSAWVSTAFTQDLVAGNITASKIVGGELDVNKIVVKNAQNIPITSTVSLGQKLSKIEQDAEGLKSTVRNLHSGDRNLARGNASGQDWLDFSGFNNLTNYYYYSLISYSLDKLKAGDVVTFGITMKNEGVTSGTMHFQQSGNVSFWNRDAGSISPMGNVTDFVKNGAEKALIYTIPITDGMLNGNTSYNIGIRTDNVPAGGKLSFRYAFVKKGTLATDWSPAPEDVDASISQVKQTADNITAYVKGSNGSSILSSILSMDPNNSSIAQLVNNKPVAAINFSKEGNVQIDGSRISLNSATTIPDATIKSSMIESLSADKITAGTIDASRIRVVNLDANSITTGSLSAVLNNSGIFNTYTVSSSNAWDFNDTKSAYGNWFLVGETTADHVYNGPCYNNNPSTPLTPYMYVTSRGVPGSNRYTVTVWKDNDPTQYQRVGDGSNWSNWVMLPNSQNLVSAINLSPDSVKISGKNIELDGNTTITGSLNLLPQNQRFVNNQFSQGLHNPWSWHDATVFAGSGGIQLQSTVDDQKYTIEGWSVGGLRKGSTAAVTTLAPTYLKFTLYPSWNGFNNNFSNQLCRTYIDAGRIETSDVIAGGFRFSGSKMRGLNGSLYVTNWNGTNFDNAGAAGFQVWGGIGLGRNTLYMPSTDLYIQMGNCGPGLGASYSSSSKVNVHCKKVVSQVGNTVSSRLSVKTDITPVSYDRALAAVEGTDMYDYRYVADDSGQHYVSGIIDDVNADPQYHMDGMLINKERTARIDANLVGYHHVIIQKLLERVAALEEKAK